MKLIFILLLFSVYLVSADEFYTRKFNFIEAEQLKVSVNHLEELTAKALAQRGQILQYIKGFEKNNKVLSGADLELIQKNIDEQLKMREEFYRFVNTYKNRPVLAKGESLLSLENHLKGGMLAISAAAILYDNFALCFSVVNDNSKLRRLINKGNKGFAIQKNALEKIVESFHSPEKRDTLREALEWLDEHKKTVESLITKDPQVKYLAGVLESSPSVRDIRDGFQFGDYIKFITLLPKTGTDTVVGAGEQSMNSISKIFGNSIGLVQTRKGIFHGNSQKVSEIKKQLKPMDILLEKTPFRLTDKFIPGHFGHVAIWVGSEDDLKALGMWEHPIIKPHQEQIRSGKCVLEALRNGVQLNTLEKFMDVDDVAVLRIKKGDLKTPCVRAFRQLGKEYDFNFDVETIDKIVCSELVYQVFTDIKWPTEKTLGRHTISPDNVAVKIGEGPFNLVLFYHEGKKSTDKKYRDLVGIK